jgi:hypothetical protein
MHPVVRQTDLVLANDRRMGFAIQMWPNVAYRPVGRGASLLKGLVDLGGFEPPTS